MATCEELDKIAPKLNGRREGTFAYITIKDRWPKIVTKIVDSLKRDMKQITLDYGEEAEADVRSFMEVLSKLRYLIMTDKPLTNFYDNAPDATMWNELLDDLRDKDPQLECETLTWYRGDWLFVECYLYRTIYGAAYSTIKLRDYDYFKSSKIASFTDHISHMEDSISYLLSIVEDGAPVHETFGLNCMIKTSLWGNRADMSLTGGDNSVMNQSAMHASSKLDDLILVNDIDKAVVEYLYPLVKNKEGLTNRRIDIILDNAGIELVCDLVLAEYFLSMRFADKIVVHGKSYPWFVSDVTKQDFDWTINALMNSTEICQKLASRLQKRVDDKTIEFKSHPFWTYPHAYFQMKGTAPDLYEDLAQAKFAFFKGDLNYRKLVGDRDWDLETSFKVSLRGFSPCPFMALRTLKAETVVGLSKEKVCQLTNEYDESTDWMVSGKYAVCQLSGSS
ncbi:unnamed protein product [Caenorhabditis bovis]|uniref:Sugar phosphate phosphatase n=1 Tax=Caenorhabditis bovis TaxID=2654633 RepID=A0A8S1EBP7_9PELO|nr:unnamed protein product [Caenorhabditis bovis]